MGGKVLFTASTFSHILHFHLPYLELFRALGWTVHAACGGPPAPIPGADLAVALPLEKSMGSPQNLRAAALLRGLVVREGYDLIATHTSLAAFFTRLALVGLRERPAVANMVHGYLFDDGTGPLKRSVLLAAERWMAPRTDLVLTMNRWDHETAQRRRLGRRVVHIPGVGVDFARLDGVGPEEREALRRQWGISPSAFVVFYAAEFSRRKSQDVLIRALAHLPREVVLVLAGDGALRRDCQALAGRLAPGRVVFPGQVESVAPWYAAADAVAAASRSEGLPFNVMEAMYCALPVVASGVKGHVDLLREGETGLLYPYGDAQACAAQLLRLVESPSLAGELGRRARAQAEQYRLERVLPLVMEAYGTLLPAPVPR